MSRKSLQILAATLTFLGVGATGAWAQSSAAITITYQVDEIHVISTSTNTSTLHITTAVPGSAPTSVSDSAITWAVTHNESTAPALKVAGKINTAMDTGLTLTVTMTAPTASGTSAGPVAMSTSDQDLVTGMGVVSQSGIAMTLQLSATNAAGPISSSQKTLTLSLLDS